jgi:hypothetical protein
MNQKELINSIESTFKLGIEIVRKKNVDYACPETDAFKNFRSASIVGVDPKRAILVRILDKLSRVANLLDKQTQHVENESVTDTLLDLVNYTAILKAYIEDENTKKS